MSKNVVPLFSFVVLFMSYSVVVEIASSGYQMTDLLKTQLDLQISLSIPKYYAEAFAQNPSTAFDEAVDFLSREQVPFRLFLNQGKPSRLLPMQTRT